MGSIGIHGAVFEGFADAVGDFLEGVFPDFGEGGVVPIDGEEVEDGGLEADSDVKGVDEFAGILPDAFGAHNATGSGLGLDLDKAVFGFHKNGFAVIVEGIGGAEEGDAPLAEGALAHPGEGDLGIGEDDVERKIVVHGLDLLAEGVPGGPFALLDGDVDDFLGSGDIAGGVNAWVGGAHVFVAGDMTGGSYLHSGVLETEPLDIGLAAKGVEEGIGLDDVEFGSLVEGDANAAALSFFDSLEAGPGMKADAFIAESALDDLGSRDGKFLEDVVAALNLGDLCAEAIEVLRKLAGNDTAAEDNDGLGKGFELKDVVAGEGPDFVEAGNLGPVDDRTGGNDKKVGGEPGAIRKLNGIGSDKGGALAVKLIEVGLKGLDATLGELLDHGALALTEGGHIGMCVGDDEAEFFGMASVVEDLGGIDDGFGRHAAAADAEASEILAVVNNGDTIPAIAGGSGGGISGTAAPDDDEVKMVSHCEWVENATKDLIGPNEWRGRLPCWFGYFSAFR